MSTIPALATLPPGLTAPDPSARGAHAAREFEASLIASLLASLEKTFSSIPGQDPAPGADDYNYLGTHALAEAIAGHGGFGIAHLIESAIKFQQPTVSVMHSIDQQSPAAEDRDKSQTTKDAKDHEGIQRADFLRVPSRASWVKD